MPQRDRTTEPPPAVRGVLRGTNDEPALRLSAAIRRGAALVPPTQGMYFRFDASSEDWARNVAHRGELLGADALGAALIALVGDAPSAIERIYEGPAGHPSRVLRDLYPWLWTEQRQCPACSRNWTSPAPQMLLSLLWHLQDQHNWTRERVADYLEQRGR